MAIVYFVRTGSYLPKSKQYFDCRCKALNYIQEIIEKHATDLDEDHLDCSIDLISIDEEKLPNHRKYYIERSLQPAPLKKDDAIND